MEFDKKMEAKRCSTSWLWMLPISSDFDTNIKPIWAVKWYTETGVELKCKVQTDVDGNLTEMVIQINWKRLVKSMPKWRWQTQLTECVFCFFYWIAGAQKWPVLFWCEAWNEPVGLSEEHQRLSNVDFEQNGGGITSWALLQYSSKKPTGIHGGKNPFPMHSITFTAQ